MRPLLDAVVIGAGQAGLGVSFRLGQRRLEHRVLERGRVGETWRSQRWDSFALNTPGWMNLLPGETQAVGDPDGFLGRDAHADHLAAYAERLGSRVETGATVTRVSPASGNRRAFLVEMGGGERVEARNVVVASGVQNVARVPPFAERLPAHLVQRTAATYRSATQLPDGAILVVGSGQSGAQIADDLLDGGRRVFLCTSAVSRLRRRYRGRDSMAWLAAMGFYDRRPAELDDPRVMLERQPLISGVGPRGRSLSLQALTARGATLLGRPSAVRRGRLVLDDSVGHNIAFGDERAAEIVGRIDAFIRATDPAAPPAEHDAADEPHAHPSAVHGPASLDLDQAGISAVVWTTGFGGDYGWLPSGVVDAQGKPLHRDGVTAVPGLYVVGMPWLRTRSSGIIRGVDGDARAIVDDMTRRMAQDG